MRAINKEIYIYFGFAIILLLVMTVLGFLLFSRSAVPHVQPAPTLQPVISREGSVSYDLNAQRKLLQTAKNPPALSPTDQAAKKKIIALAPSGSEVIYQSKDFTIYYVSGADLFQGEILTTDIAKAKKETADWFISQGMSHQGICSLPLMFYLNQNVSNQLQGSNVIFSPLPEGC